MRKLLIILIVIVSATGLWIAARSFSSRTSSQRKEPIVDSQKKTDVAMNEDNSMPGLKVKALCVAYDALSNDSDIPAEKRKIENYNVSIREGHDAYEVYFEAKLAPGEQPHFGGSTQLGKDVSYFVSNRTFRVVNRTFYK